MTGTLLNAEEIFDSTAKKNGLEKYAAPDLRKRFASLIESFNANGPIPEWSRPAALAQLSAVVKERLELARDWEMYPEIAQESIEKPFFVVGSARTGTTLMQALLSLGDGCRTTMSWECRHPSPPPGLDPASEPARIAADNAHILDLINLYPIVLLYHAFFDQLGFMEVEDEDIFAVDFHTAFPWHFFRIPSLPIEHHKRETGLVDALRFHKKFLQQLQWKRPTGRWVCKTPQHFFELPATWEVYPDALCVFMHRDPAVFVASVLTAMQGVFTPLTGTPMRGEFAHELVNSLAGGYEAIMSSNWINDERLVHVHFDDLVKDPVEVIHGIYDHANMRVSPEYEGRMRSWLADPANKGDRHAKFLYSLEQFELDPADIRKKFAGYYERFVKR
jgi:hypothetical protein